MWCGILLLAWAGQGVCAEKAVVDFGERYYSPGREVVTPHIAWANPYAKGKLRVLFIDLRTRMREVVEFAQRLEMDYAFAAAYAVKNHDEIFLPGRLRGGWYKGDEPGDKIERLRTLLSEPDYDLIVVGSIDWRDLPLFAKYEILRRVKAGTGLVSIGRGAYNDEYRRKACTEKIDIPSSIVAGVPWQALPAFASYPDSHEFVSKTLSAWQFGEGIIVTIEGYQVPDFHILSPGFTSNPLNGPWYAWWGRRPAEYKAKYPEIDLPITDVKLLDYDYNLAWLTKVMLFAAGKMPEITVDEEGVVRDVDRETLSEIGFRLQSDLLEAVTGLTAQSVLRDRDNKVVASATRQGVTATPGRSLVAFPVSNVPAGQYFADLWLKRDGQVLTFGSLALNVRSKRGFRSVKLVSDHFGKEDAVKVMVEIEGAKLETGNLRLGVKQTDNHGRLVRESSFSIQNSTFSIALPPIPAPLTVWQFLTVDLVSGDTVLDRRRIPFSLSNLYLADTIRVGTWQPPRSSYLSFRLHARLYDVGFDSSGYFFNNDHARHDVCGTGPYSSLEVGRSAVATLSNLRFIAPVLRVTDMGIKEWSKGHWWDHKGEEPVVLEYGVRYPCVNDPRYLKLAHKRAGDIVGLLGKTSTVEYMFDQEPCFAQMGGSDGQLCYCPLCAKYFRDFLHGEYGNIGALNAEYGSGYKTFDDVRPIRLEEAATNRALGPQWIDFRRAMDDSFNGFYKGLTETMQAIQPETKTGDSAPIYQGFRSSEAVDIWQFSRWTKISQPYPSATEQIRADFAVPGAMINRGCWWGPAVSRSKEFAGLHPWRDLFEGTSFFYSYYGDTRSCLIAHDYSLYPDLAHRIDQWMEIKNGLGKLIHEAERSHGGVALLYSIASVHHWTLSEARGDVPSEGGRTGTIASRSFWMNTAAWMAVLTDGNGPFRFVSYQQLAEGVLKQGGFKLLILPWSQALSDAEVDQIKAFARAGGTVLADLRPGVSDWHSKPYEQSPLDEVFGVVQNTTAPGIKKVMVNAPFTAGGEPEPFGVAKTDLSLTTAAGEALGTTEGGAPALVVNTYGAGKGILLNFAVDAYLMSGNYLPRSVHAPRIRAFIAHLLQETGVGPAIGFSPEQEDLRHHVFTSGRLTYVGLLQELPEDRLRYAEGTARPLPERMTTVRLPSIAHVYDARAGRYMGHAGQITTYIKPGIARVFSLLPYRVTGVTVNAPAETRQGAELAYTVDVAATARPEQHVVHVALLDPEGNSIRHYAGNVRCTGGRHAGTLRLALNERPGMYVLAVRDAATGKRGQTRIEVTEL